MKITQQIVVSDKSLQLQEEKKKNKKPIWQLLGRKDRSSTKEKKKNSKHLASDFSFAVRNTRGLGNVFLRVLKGEKIVTEDFYTIAMFYSHMKV